MDAVQRVAIDDLVLRVRPDVNRDRWNEDKYEPFLDRLCGSREYQKEAVRTVMRFVLGGEYASLRDLDEENWHRSESLQRLYGTWATFERQLQLPDMLAASVDLATGTGKTFVMYGTAAILLSEGAVDRVLVLCPSTTIERGLLAAFRRLAGRADLADALPAEAAVRVPRIIDGDQTIIAGSICIENRDAVYAHVGSSVRSSVSGRGHNIAVLNDEAHHVANDSRRITRWKEFLLDPTNAFRIVLGFSGTCYVGNEYFSDVVYRYSLRRAIEQRFVKTIKYLTDAERTGELDEDWQHRLNMHEKKRLELASRNIRPLTLIVTPTINRCKQVADELRGQLALRCELSSAELDARVLVIYNDAPDVTRLIDLDDASNPVEWVVSVSMLTEGWDVKRVFQIVPHEERAFNSKLLIAQVLGRGLRIPEQWGAGSQPEVAVVNHARWAPAIRDIVDEILEMERALIARVIPDSPYHFAIHNLDYEVKPRCEEKTKRGPFDILSHGVDIPTEAEALTVNIGFTSAGTGTTEVWESEIKRQLHAPEDVARQMHSLLVKLDMENSGLAADDRTSYAADYSYERLLGIVRTSLKGQAYCTEANKQKLLQALGTLRRRITKVVRYELDPGELIVGSTRDKPPETASASQLRRDRIAFVPSDAEQHVPEEQREFFAEVTEPGGVYRCVHVANRYDFKSPVAMTFVDGGPEKKFVTELLKSPNASVIDAWIKSSATAFYSIDYWWKKGTHPKRGSFNPDFFLQIGDVRVVIEVKGDEELRDPSPETVKKHEYAVAHFARINDKLEEQQKSERYMFHCLAPQDFPDFFAALRAGSILNYSSRLDVSLRRELLESEAV